MDNTIDMSKTPYYGSAVIILLLKPKT